MAAVNSLDLRTILGRKNPYLFRAIGTQSAPEMIRRLLAAHLSSSDEGIFGSEFFEPICHAVLKKGMITGAKGSDMMRETTDAYEAIALKSGPNIFNSDASSKQNDRFAEMAASLRATLRSMRKQFIPIMGCGYGRVDSEPTKKRHYYKLAGQAFWEKITGDPDFYLKLIRLMQDLPEKHRQEMEAALAKAENRLVAEFTESFCAKDGTILWEELTKFNSGKPKMRRSN